VERLGSQGEVPLFEKQREGANPAFVPGFELALAQPQVNLDEVGALFDGAFSGGTGVPGRMRDDRGISTVIERAPIVLVRFHALRMQVDWPLCLPGGAAKPGCRRSR